MNDEDKNMNSNKDEHKPDDQIGLNMSGHILIKDKETGEEIVNKRNVFDPMLVKNQCGG